MQTRTTAAKTSSPKGRVSAIDQLVDRFVRDTPAEQRADFALERFEIWAEATLLSGGLEFRRLFAKAMREWMTQLTRDAYYEQATDRHHRLTRYFWSEELVPQ
jgi:hypothetical protein